MKVLLIEDDKFYAKQVQTLFQERLGIDVDVVYSKQEYETLESIDEYKYILLDVYLKDCMDCSLVDEIIATNKPIVVITSSEDTGIFEKYSRKKIIDFVIKHDMVRLEYLVMKMKILQYLEEHKVLVVEESASYRRYLSTFFQIYYPYSDVTLAKNKEEAKALLEKNKDLVKLVIVNSESSNQKDGLELVKEIRTNFLYEDIAVIALLDFDQERLMTRFLKSGANDFLDKRFSNIEFVCRIDNVIKSLIQFEEIKNYSNTDYLTGCYNRRYLFDAGLKLFQNLKRLKKDVSVALLDLDHFKRINDTYGHLVGDKVLKQFANILKQSVRGGDFVVRFGGEEFLLFLGSCDKEMAKKIVEERIRKEVHKSLVEYEGKKIAYDFSCGICDSGETLEELIKRADEKLYQAKKQRGITIA